MGPAERIAEIRKRCEAATKGPWLWGYFGGDVINPCHYYSYFGKENCYKEQDKDFIAYSRDDIPWLLSQLEAVTKERDQAQAFARMQSAQEKLRVAEEALQWALEMFTARDEMNAKVHCAPVRLSPITERVSQALAKIRAQSRAVCDKAE